MSFIIIVWWQKEREIDTHREKKKKSRGQDLPGDLDTPSVMTMMTLVMSGLTFTLVLTYRRAKSVLVTPVRYGRVRSSTAARVMALVRTRSRSNPTCQWQIRFQVS